jgi:hypothetical protein
MNKNQLQQIIKEELQKVMSEVHQASGSPEFNKLVKLLQAAVLQAEKVARDAVRNNPDAYEGTEGNDVSMLLEEIWNGFSTGKRTDSSTRDEIFK